MKSDKIKDFVNTHPALADAADTVLGILGGAFFVVGVLLVWAKEIISRKRRDS